MWASIAFYVAIMAGSAFEGRWWRCLYYFGATVITVAVLGMTERKAI
jgi:hypothetical protein